MTTDSDLGCLIPTLILEILRRCLGQKGPSKRETKRLHYNRDYIHKVGLERVCEKSGVSIMNKCPA